MIHDCQHDDERFEGYGVRRLASRVRGSLTGLACKSNLFRPFSAHRSGQSVLAGCIAGGASVPMSWCRTRRGTWKSSRATRWCSGARSAVAASASSAIKAARRVRFQSLRNRCCPYASSSATPCSGDSFSPFTESSRPVKVLETWDHLPEIRASRATEIRDEFVAAREENTCCNAENIAKQLDRELEGRMAPVRAFEAAEKAARERVKGVEVTVPEPAWASAPSEDDE
jgi:hypothetical protein